MADKPRLLIIVDLTREEEVDIIMKSAKRLRNSIDPVLRNSVFINQDLTKAEAKAAYELRQRNKLRKLNPSRVHEDGRSMDTLPVQQGISAHDSALSKDLPVRPPSVILPAGTRLAIFTFLLLQFLPLNRLVVTDIVQHPHAQFRNCRVQCSMQEVYATNWLN